MLFVLFVVCCCFFPQNELFQEIFINTTRVAYVDSEALREVLGNTRKRSNFEGNKGTKTILGNRERKKTQIFDFWGTGEQANLFQGNRGTGTPTPMGGPRQSEAQMNMLDRVLLISNFLLLSIYFKLFPRFY